MSDEAVTMDISDVVAEETPQEPPVSEEVTDAPEEEEEAPEEEEATEEEEEAPEEEALVEEAPEEEEAQEEEAPVEEEAPEEEAPVEEAPEEEEEVHEEEVAPVTNGEEVVNVSEVEDTPVANKTPVNEVITNIRDILSPQLNSQETITNSQIDIKLNEIISLVKNNKDIKFCKKTILELDKNLKLSSNTSVLENPNGKKIIDIISKVNNIYHIKDLNLLVDRIIN